jgi:RNA polymerase sigma-70 factor (ECF subfamily)
MHNVHVNQVRAAARRDTSVSLSDEAMAVPTAGNQSDMLEVRDVAACLAQIPLEQREVLLLISLEDLSYAEASQVLNVPVGTIMSRLARGRARLRALLDGSASATGLKVVK